MFQTKLSFLILLIASCFTAVTSAKAKNTAPESEALYIVPTAPELIEYSRFKIKIVKPYLDEQTQIISYVFPEVLVGEPNRIIEFQKVPGTMNEWQSQDAQAFCTVTDDIFSCNIVLNKKISHLMNYIFSRAFAQTSSLAPSPSDLMSSIHRGKSIDHLKTMNLNPQDFVAFEQVVQSFFSNEPAGILSYEIN